MTELDETSTGTGKITLGTDAAGYVALGIDPKGNALFWDPNITQDHRALSTRSLTARARVLQAIASGAEFAVVDLKTAGPFSWCGMTIVPAYREHTWKALADGGLPTPE